MKFLQRLLAKLNLGLSELVFKSPTPWLDRPSLLAFLREQIEPVTGRLAAERAQLPDDDIRYPVGTIRWADGDIDVVSTNHLSQNLKPNQDTAQNVSVVKKIGVLLKQIAEKNSARAKVEIYGLVEKRQCA